MGNPETGVNWGVFGGLFDPVHDGHLVLARDCLRLKSLDKILFVPSLRPPHRTDGPVATFAQRVAMLQSVLSAEAHMEVSTLESEMDGPGYTLLLVREFRKRYPDVDFSFIMGADNIRQISGWYRPEEIFREVTVLAGVRPGFDLTTSGLPGSYPIELVETGAVDTASTDIRRLLLYDRDNPHLTKVLPEAVLAYIRKHRLYTHDKATDGISG